MVNVDMIGYVEPGDEMDLDIISNAPSTWLRDLVVEVAGEYVPELPLIDAVLGGNASSDHARFWEAGYHAIMFLDDVADWNFHIHGPNDVVGTSYNSPRLAELSVKTAGARAATLAEPDSWITVEHAPLENTEETGSSYNVFARIEAARLLEPDSLFVHYESSAAGTDTAWFYPREIEGEYDAEIPAQVGGTFVDYYLVVEDDNGNRITHPPGASDETHSFFVGVISEHIADDFESDSGWTVGSDDDDADLGIWERVDPNGTWNDDEPVQPEDDHTPAPGTHCFVTGNAPPGGSQSEGDVDGGQTTLLSPVYNLAGLNDPRVVYRRWYSMDTGTSPDDSFFVDVSPDGGDTWVNFETITESRRRWERVEKRIIDTIESTDQVRFRFIAADKGLLSIVEAAIDDFVIITYQDPQTPIDDDEEIDPSGDPTSPIAFITHAPNPSGQTATIRFNVPAPARRVSLRVFDVSGREVAVLIDGERLAGLRSVHWDGTDDSGRRVAAGTYFLKLVAGEETLSRKHVVIR